MSARSLLLWSSAAFFALSGAMVLVAQGENVATLEQGLGPVVETLPL